MTKLGVSPPTTDFRAWEKVPPGEGILLEGEVTQSGSFGEGRIWKTTAGTRSCGFTPKGPL